MRLFQTNHYVEPDAKDAEILARKESLWNERKGPRVGDFVLIGDRVGRFSHSWDDGIQWSEGGSFYLGDGGVSFSGGLKQAIPYKNLALVGETREGDFWFFHHGHAGAHRGVGVRIPCRVYRAKTKAFTVTTDGTARVVEAVDRSDAWSEGVRLERKAQGKPEYWYPATVTVEGLPCNPS